MGVLDVKKHLRGEREDTSDWVDDFLDQPVATAPPEAPPPAERSRPKQRIPKTPRPSSYGRGNGRKAKGSRCSRRQENAWFLRTLVPVDEDAELDSNDLDISDFIAKSATTVFTTLFNDNNKMDIWIKFIELTETEQEQFLNKRLDRNPAATFDQSSKEVTTDEQRVPEQAPSAEKCFMKIDKSIRNVFKKRIPMGILQYFEEEMLFSFKECPEAIVVSLLPSSFERLMMHGLCQYLGLSSLSDEYNGIRHTEIENKREVFNPPDISLTQYLEEKR